MTKDEYNDMMIELNREYLSVERMNLDIPCEDIVAIGDIGRWNGRVPGYKMLESGNIKDCLQSSCDYNEWYIDKLGDLRCTAVHHDGVNHYLYRAIKENIRKSQIDKLQEKIYNGVATRADITRSTRRLGDEIAMLYGFKIPRMSQLSVSR